jgi:thiol-disulfide isomerase/thioredoxin
MRHTLAIGAIPLLLLVTAGCTDDDGQATPTTFPGDRVEVEPNIPETDDLTGAVLPSLRDASEPVAFADYEGRPLVVNFFASTCAPCVQEMPAIESVKQDLGDAVAFVGVATNDRVDDAIERAEQAGVTWDLANDARGELIAAVGGVVLPTTLLVDADGRIVEVHSGELHADELRDLLREDLGVDA